MTPTECLAQLGAALLSLKQLGAQAESMKIAAFLLGFGLALGLGIMFTSLFYERRFQAGIAFQRRLDTGLLPPESSLAKQSGLMASVARALAYCVIFCVAFVLWCKDWSDRIEQFATMERRLPRL